MTVAAEPFRALGFRLRLPCPPPERTRWGDYYFARSLADALERRGHRVLMDYMRKRPWLHRVGSLFSTFRPDVDLILRGKIAFDPHPARPTIMWLISNANTLTTAEIAGASHVFVASTRYAARLAEQGFRHASVLLQCTDSTVFFPDRRSEAHRTHCLIVANRREFERPAVTYALQAGVPLSVWGRNWGATLPEGVLVGTHIDNADLGMFYASADIVLNDHTPDMLENHFTSNRAYDVLACGVPLITDGAEDLPEEIAGSVYGFKDYGSFLAAYRAATAETEARRAGRRALAEVVRTRHSFDARARVIEEKALALDAARRHLH
jgi:spore maturation protein CgeB